MGKALKLTARAAIRQVLEDNGGKMGVPAIIAAAVPLSKLGGKTPGQSIYSTLYAENKKADGIFKQTGRGTFKLDKKNAEKADKAAAAKVEAKNAPAPAKRTSRKADDQTIAEAAATADVVEAPVVEESVAA